MPPRPAPNRPAFAVSLCVLATSVVVCSAETPGGEPGSGLEELFRQNSRTLVLQDGRLAGDGADFLISEAGDTRFFCIGEPHNVREIPGFVTALFRQLQEKQGFHYLAIEQGPFITNRIGSVAGSQEKELRRFGKKNKKALHFRTVEEVEMMAAVWQASEGSIQGVWGLDRVLAPAPLEDHLASSSGKDDPEAPFLRERGEWSAKNLSMYRSPPGSSEGLSANQHREDGFKSGFEYYYRRATTPEDSTPRVVFRFGHVHMGRLANRRYGSLGHYLSRLAEDDDTGSFHLNLQLINRPGHYWSLTEYPEYEPLANVGDPDRWILVDLRPARAALRAEQFPPHDKLARLILDFDAVLLLGGASKGHRL
jgi:hypothetical protein